MKKIAASDSRQSVGLKWKTRKGLEKLIDFEGNKIKVKGDFEVDGKAIAGSVAKATLPNYYEELPPQEVIITEFPGFSIEGQTVPPCYGAFGTMIGDGPDPVGFFAPVMKKVGENDYVNCTSMDDAIANGILAEPYQLMTDITTRDAIDEKFSQLDNYLSRSTYLNTTYKEQFSKAKYQHTVTIKGTRPAQGGGSCFITFTAYSSKNTPIDSAQDLIDVFGGCNLSVSGMYSPAQGTNFGAVELMLDGASTIADASLAYIDPSIINESGVKMSECGNLSFTDDVCVPK